MTRALRIATRGSALALAQTERVVRLLGVPTELVIVSTKGDRDTVAPIHAIGGTGVFTKEIQDAVLRNDADIAVHSAKDLPSLTPDGLVIGAVPERDDVRDALVGATLDELPTGARVGTGAPRRRAQLAAERPDLTFGELRGNIATRMDKASEFGAIVVAMAAINRLGLGDRVAQILETSVMLPQVGQGAIAVECRSDDQDTLDTSAGIDNAQLHRVLNAERAYLAELGGGCNLPCGALASESADGIISLEVLLANLDGSVVLRISDNGTDPEHLGHTLARRLLDDHGGALLLEDSR